MQKNIISGVGLAVIAVVAGVGGFVLFGPKQIASTLPTLLAGDTGSVQSGPSTLGINDVPSATATLPGTTLHLVLRGIIGADNTEYARAIIVDTAGNEALYRVGETVAPHTTLEAIRTNAVDIRLSDNSIRTLFISNAVNEAIGNDPDTGTQALVRVLAKSITEGPEAIIRFLDAKPVIRDNRMVGYQVFPPEDPELLDRIGLEPGDIVTAINDKAITSRDRLGTALKSLVTASKIKVDFQRNGIREIIYISAQN